MGRRDEVARGVVVGVALDLDFGVGEAIVRADKGELLLLTVNDVSSDGTLRVADRAIDGLLVACTALAGVAGNTGRVLRRGGELTVAVLVVVTAASSS